MDISGNQLYDIMRSYNQNIQLHCENMRDYNENIRRYIHIMSDIYNDRIMHTNPIGYVPLRSSNEASYTAPIINTFIRNYLNNRAEGAALRFEDVVVRPTAEQIENATDTVIFDEADNNHNTSCPITLEQFQHGDELCSIRYCSHLFRRNALMDWFRQNVRCPVCRYDIRDYVPPLIEEPDENPSITSLLVNSLRTFVNNELNHGQLNTAAELLYTFDIPIQRDLSGNFRV